MKNFYTKLILHKYITNNLIPIKHSNFKQNKVKISKNFFLSKSLSFLKCPKLAKRDIFTFRNTSTNLNFVNQMYYKTSIYSNFLIHKQNFSIYDNKVFLKTNFSPEYTISSSLLNTFNFQNSLKDVVLYENIFLEKNNISRQQRWLTHNSLNSNVFIQDLNRNNSNKAFLQNPFYNYNLLNSNIWASTKLSSGEIEQLTNSYKFTNTKLLTMYNTFSESQFFINQRYFFLNNLGNNLFTNKILPLKLINHVYESDFSSLILLVFSKNFTNNTLLYYPLFSSNAQNIDYFSHVNLIYTQRIQSFYTLDFYDFLEKNNLVLLLNLNTTNTYDNRLCLNKNLRRNNFLLKV